MAAAKHQELSIRTGLGGGAAGSGDQAALLLQILEEKKPSSSYPIRKRQTLHFHLHFLSLHPNWTSGKDHLLYLPLLAELFLMLLFGFFLLLLLFHGLPVLHTHTHTHENAAVKPRHRDMVEAEGTHHFRVEGDLLGQTDAVADLKAVKHVKPCLALRGLCRSM